MESSFGESNRFAMGAGTRLITTTGAQAFSGLGFKPRAVHLINTVNGTGNLAVGEFIAGVDKCTNDRFQSYAHGPWIQRENALYVEDNPPDNAWADITSMNVDGFTITWAKSGTPSAWTAQQFWIAIK